MSVFNSTKRGRISVAALAAAVVGALPAAALGAEVAATAGRSSVAAYRDFVAFSKQDDNGRYKLVAGRLDGPLRTLRVPSRAVPFDVDLGPGPDGRPTAVYSRCASEPFVNPGSAVSYFGGRGCRLYRSVLGESGEQLLKRISGRPGSKFLPTIWRVRIAYASRVERRARAELYLSSLSGERLRLRGGPSGDASPEASPLALDLRGTRLAFSWSNSPETCPRYSIDPEARVEPEATGLYVVRVGSRASRRLTACNQTAEAFAVAGAAWHGDEAVAGLVTLEGPDLRSFGLKILSSSTSRSLGGYPGGELAANSIAVADNEIVVAALVRPPDRSDGGTRIVRLPLAAEGGSAAASRTR